MKMLFLLQDWPYPPSNGYRQKIFNLISYIGRTHQCDVFALGTASDLQRSTPWFKYLPGLRVLGVFSPDKVHFLFIRQLLKFVFSSDSPSWLRYRSHRLEQAIDLALSNNTYDIVHIDMYGMAQYCLRFGRMRSVLSLNDSMSMTLFHDYKNLFMPFWMRVSSLARAWHQVRVDKVLFGLADVVHFVGAYDAEWCRNRFGVSNVVHIPLAVEDVFLKTKRNSDLRNGIQKLLIIDKLWAPQHRKAVKQFLSKYWMVLYAKYPNVKLTVIGGKGMPSDFQHFVRNLPGVELHEWVDRLEDTLAETDITIFLYSAAAGMKNRVLQCMAAMNAIVGTPNAFLGLPVQHRQHALIVNNQRDCAMGIEELLGSEALRDQIGRSAREFILQHFSQDVAGRAWERMYEDLIKGKAVSKCYL